MARGDVATPHLRSIRMAKWQLRARVKYENTRRLQTARLRSDRLKRTENTTVCQASSLRLYLQNGLG